ncbi:DUF7158 domain-containing protein [Nocardia arthritidis]|uniref:Uncharacterized protein n=1 Tax=Nocardia arthritidis TaxID=228602 RepID=A0A6G9YDK1_9NOCA|nr:hypothetical protein [Nocardia arthritidis]QIS11355.1 hypothetical protein F5544_17395 [Nocardia arthritidis]
MIRQDAPVIGWIDGAPVPRERLDARLAALHAGRRAAALPKTGTSEYRQLIRWTAHVICTEELCRRAVPMAPRATVPLDAVGAVQLGSINYAAWQSDPAVAAAFLAVIPGADREVETPDSVRWWRIRYAMGTGNPPPARPSLSSLGWSTLDDLPVVLAAAARAAVPGTVIGPLIDGNRWYYLRVDEIAHRPARIARRDDGERLRAFARWLDLRRSESLVMAPGFEHPGDTDQPDNTHRH